MQLRFFIKRTAAVANRAEDDANVAFNHAVVEKCALCNYALIWLQLTHGSLEAQRPNSAADLP